MGDVQRRAMLDELLFFNAAKYQPAMTRYVYPPVFERKSPKQSAEKTVESMLSRLDKILSKSSHVAGTPFTIADIALYYSTSNLEVVGSELMQNYSNVTRWYASCKQRPSWQEANI